MRAIITCLLLSVLVCASASAMTLSDLTAGTTVAGPKLTPKDLKGKVVFVVYWGTHCPICLGEIPHWEAMYKKHNQEGFEIVGMECQNSTEAEIVALTKMKGMDYDVTTGGRLNGANVTGIPHGYLFAADGTMVADNPLSADLEKKVATLIRESAGAMAGPGPYVKLAPLAAQIKAGVGLGTVLKTLSTKKASKDAVESAEATMMFDALHGSAQEQLENAIEKKAEDPLGALAKLDKLAAQFSGDEIAKKAADESIAMKKDPAIKKEIEAGMMWKQIEALNEKLKPVKGAKNPADEAFRKANLPAIQSMIVGCQTINQRFPGTIAANKAQGLMESYH